MDYAILKWDVDENEKMKFIDTLAPIVLFTYNRLEHTKKTVEALQKNIYAKESRLIIYADGAKTSDAMEVVSNVRKYLYTIDGFKSVEIIERHENWGLARNIIDGVTKIVNEYGKIIVLEDDIVTSKYFLKYMNDALEIYKNKEKIMAVSSYFWPRDKEGLSETFFLQPFACWGWGTWKESWQYFERDSKKIINTFTEEDIYHFNIDGGWDFWNQIISNQNGSLYTWAIFFFAAIFKRDGLVVYTKDDLSKNIGMDGSGEHCGPSDDFNPNDFKDEKDVKLFSLNIKESCFARDKAKMFFLNLKPKPYKRIYSWGKNIMKKLWGKY